MSLSCRRTRAGVVAVGTTFDILDDFNAENDFHGGEIGLDTVIRRGCWDFDILTKLALGNMHEVAAINGQTIITAPTQTPLVGRGGLLALPTNMGTYSWNEFAMIPELNLNLRYHFSECLSLTMGYSLLWITDIARTGDQIDLVVNRPTTYQRRQPDRPAASRTALRPHRHVGARRQSRRGLGILIPDSFASDHSSYRLGSHASRTEAVCVLAVSQLSGNSIPMSLISIFMSSQVARLALGLRSK